MKSNKIRWLLPVFMLFVLAVTLVSCKSTSVIPPTKIETVDTTEKNEWLRDTTVNVAKDSSYYKAWLECINGKVVIKNEPLSNHGRKLQPPEVRIRDNILQVDCKAEAEKYLLYYKDKWFKEFKRTHVKEPVVITKPLTRWQTTQIWLGRILILLIIVAIIGWLRKATKFNLKHI